MSTETITSRLTIFQGPQRLLQADRLTVLRYLQNHDELHPGGSANPLWVFDDLSGLRLDLNWRAELAPPAEASADNADASLPTANSQPVPADTAAHSRSTRTVGRPKLGVVSREVTLLPRHWEWLNRQPGGASAALRRLIEDARNAHAQQDSQRAATEATYQFMQAMAGDLPGFDEACRALFAHKQPAFLLQTQAWPDDVQAYLHQLSRPIWPV
ncbi:DUF2239 family protein [Comamonas piscis]|uniref:DUF2239 family protein n=1 Tax=Comamonas piscis TaxID=1562974 RepID=A0A7G5EG41_9BURK|nr:DUF2239 family protein [Comamonas piscis]QMV72966.1 DUF2239 family protein [Comamonas piscis]WSO35747.1 DUF2239 family protein [Comamonas piscis]